jgi:hypothetical protein
VLQYEFLELVKSGEFAFSPAGSQSLLFVSAKPEFQAINTGQHE